YDKVELTSFLDLLPVYASHLPLPTRTQDSVTLSRPGLRGGPFTHLESTQLSGRTPGNFTAPLEIGLFLWFFSALMSELLSIFLPFAVCISRTSIWLVQAERG
ncbi:hypothetical protein, partial [Thiolapillus sp.]